MSDSQAQSSTAQALFSARRMFSAGHLYRQSAWSEEKNRRVFGACYSSHGHGHNYVLEVTIRGEIQTHSIPPFGRALEMSMVENLLREVVKPLDHQHLNFDIAEFTEADPQITPTSVPPLVPTTENIALYLRARVLIEIQKLRAMQIEVELARLKLFETPELWVEIEE